MLSCFLRTEDEPPEDLDCIYPPKKSGCGAPEPYVAPVNVPPKPMKYVKPPGKDIGIQTPDCESANVFLT